MKFLFSWKYLVFITPLLATALGGGYLGLNYWQKEDDTFTYTKVDRGPIRVTLRESAIIQPEHRLNVTPPIPGRIDSVNVENGAAVKQGQVLAWISSVNRAALMDAARAKGGKEVDFWADVYKAAPLVAPLDGHIISTAVVPGQVVAAAQPVFTMSDHLIVQAFVDETDLAQVHEGQAVDVTFDSFPDTHLTGKVDAIAYDSTTVNNVTTYQVNIFLDSTPDYVRSGISANVYFLISDEKNVLRIPTSAITPESEVYTAPGPDQPTTLTSVKLGPSDGTWTEVLEGLQEGDFIAERVFTVKTAQAGFTFTSRAPRIPVHR